MLIPLTRKTVEALIPAVATGDQYKHYWGKPQDLLKRLLISVTALIVVLVIGAATRDNDISGFCRFIFGIATGLYWFWYPIYGASLQNRTYRRYPYGGLWQGEVLDAFVTEELVGTEETVNRKGELVLVEDRERRINLEVGDDSGFRTLVQAPFLREHKTIYPGMPVQLLLLSQEKNLSRISKISDAYLPNRDLWISDYPYLRRDTFLEVSRRVMAEVDPPDEGAWVSRPVQPDRYGYVATPPNRRRPRSGDRSQSAREYGGAGYGSAGYGAPANADRRYGEPADDDWGDNDRGYDDRGYDDRGYGDSSDRRQSSAQSPRNRPIDAYRYGPQDYDPQDYGPQDYGSQDYSSQGYSTQTDHGQGYGDRDFGPRRPNQTYAGSPDRPQRGQSQRGQSQRASQWDRSQPYANSRPQSWRGSAPMNPAPTDPASNSGGSDAGYGAPRAEDWDQNRWGYGNDRENTAGRWDSGWGAGPQGYSAHQSSGGEVWDVSGDPPLTPDDPAFDRPPVQIPEAPPRRSRQPLNLRPLNRQADAPDGGV